MRIISLTILLTSLLFSLNGNAQQRPKIGLVLSGGGAKGAAHIGVLKVLEENKIPIDYIVGTSIGAYVGGLYALGYSVNEIENIMLNLPWDKSYSDFVPRESLQYADQELRDKYNISLRIGYSAGQIKMPSGLLLGQTATQLLRRSTDVVSTFEHFDQLAIPYRAVATDLVTATAVILDAGSLTKAMSASAAVPGILEPVMIGGRLLVDGGITNNMPIDVIKKMGADIVIAVDIGSPLAKQNQINDTVDVLNQLSTIVTNNTSIEQKKRLAANDILIRPAIDELSTTDFSIMPQALILGEQSATEHLEHLSLYALNDNEYLAYIENKQRRSRQWFDSMTSPLVAIDYHNNSKVDSDIIAEHLALNTGDVVSMQTLFDAVDRVYALDKFERVDAEFIDAEDGRMLVIDTQEKTWGPNYLKFGFSLQSDFSANSIIELDFAYLLTDVTPNGGAWKNEVSVGWESMIATEFYQPIDKYQRFFSRARIEYAQDKWAQSKARPELSNDFYLSQVGLGYNYADQGVMEVGLMGERGNLSMNSQAAEQFDYKSFGAFFTVGFDDLNSINFPTHGNKLSLEVFWRNDEYSEDLTQMTSDSSIEISFNWRGALGWGNNTFVGITSLATVNNDSDFSVHVSELGGFLNISGFSKDTLIGVHKAFAAAVYQYDLGREIPGGSGLPIYLGTSVEIGNVWSINETVKADDLIKSGSLYLGTDTSFGPAVIGVGYASGGESTVFLSLGKNW